MKTLIQPQLIKDKIAQLLTSSLVMLALLALPFPSTSQAQGGGKKFINITSAVCDGEHSWTSRESALADLKAQCSKSIQKKRSPSGNPTGKVLFFEANVGWSVNPIIRTSKGASNETRYRAYQGSYTVRCYYY